MPHIVLYEPEIPMNTGNIARSCAATGASLHLIEPLGFSVSSSAVKRAGLDYWHLVDVHTHPSYGAFAKAHPGRRFFLSTKGEHVYSDVSFRDDDYLVFGKETAGLPEALLRENAAHTLRVPIDGRARSLNLANTVAIVLFEALRQLGFPALKTQGDFPSD